MCIYITVYYLQNITTASISWNVVYFFIGIKMKEQKKARITKSDFKNVGLSRNVVNVICVMLII